MPGKAQYSESYLQHYFWHIHGEELPVTPAAGQAKATYNGIITTQADAGDFAVTERDDAAVEALAAAKKVIIKLPNGLVSVELRFRSDGSDDDDSVVQLFAAAGVDHYRHVDALTVRQGTQIYTTGIYFCENIASAGETWITETKEPSPVNSIASYVMNIHGYDRLWLVASDLDTTSLYVDWKQL